jgi:WD40 repeat protein
VWDLDQPETPTTTFPLDRGSSNTVVYGADAAHLLAVGDGGRSLRRWDLTGDRQFIRALPTSSELTGLFGVLAAGGRYSVVLTENWGLTDHRTGRTSIIPAQHPYRHTYGAFHPSRPLFATATGRLIRLWDIPSGRATGPAQLIRGGDAESTPGSWITELDWTPDARYLAVSTLAGLVSLHNGRTLEQTGRPVDLREPVSFVVARPDGHTAVVITGSLEPDGSPVVVPGTGWALVDFNEGRVLRQGELDFPFLTWLAVSPDGRIAAVAGGDVADTTGNAGATGSLQLIDLTTGEPIGAPRSWEGGVRSQVAFSPEGTQLLTSSAGGIAVLWEVPTLDPIARIRVPDASNVSGAFEPDGQAVRLLDWSTGKVVVWELDFDKAVDFACRVAGRDFTSDEWREQFGDERYREAC